jgi:ABC-2 type transport system ATP-binding protein
MSEPIIHTEHLSRSFGAVKAVEDLSLEVPAGIVFGFLGPNGAGKTTTIHLLLGLLVPTQGQARVLGFDTRTQSNDIHAGCGYWYRYTPLLYGRRNKPCSLARWGSEWYCISG